MRRGLPTIAGAISVAFYLAFVFYLHLAAKRCAGMDGLFCGFGYLIAGFPWIWMFLIIAEVFMPHHYPPVPENLLWGTLLASVVINSLIFYFGGVILGKLPYV
jgi:hypothetical protein